MHERDIIAREDFCKKKGLDKTLIAELTGLSPEEIGQADKVIN